MADDGSFKGHGGKPGRKSTVVSMNAHKNRHNSENESTSKKLSGLTLLDFSPSEADEELDDTSARNQNTNVSNVLGDALPCENTPFERQSDKRESDPEEGAARVPGRKFLRWGLEDGGPTDQIDGQQSAFEDESRRRGHKWDHKTSRSGSLVESFYHALRGLQVGFVTQRNVRIHCAISLGVLILALLLKVDLVGSLALILATGFVLFAEFINTALEHVTDIQASYRYHRSARYAKDTAAAAVLIAALTAVLVGTIIFLPRLFVLFSGGQL